MAGLTDDEYNTPIRIFGSQLPIRELVHIAPNPATLNRIRQDLHAYAVRLFGLPMLPENMVQVTAQVKEILNQSVLGQLQTQLSSYNAVNSVSNLIEHTLNAMADLVLTDDSVYFGMRILRASIEFVRRLMVVLVLCVGRVHAQSFINEMIDIAISSENGEQFAGTRTNFFLNGFIFRSRKCCNRSI